VDNCPSVYYTWFRHQYASFVAKSCNHHHCHRSTIGVISHWKSMGKMDAGMGVDALRKKDPIESWSIQYQRACFNCGILLFVFLGFDGLSLPQMSVTGVDRLMLPIFSFRKRSSMGRTLAAFLRLSLLSRRNAWDTPSLASCVDFWSGQLL